MDYNHSSSNVAWIDSESLQLNETMSTSPAEQQQQELLANPKTNIVASINIIVCFAVIIGLFYCICKPATSHSQRLAVIARQRLRRQQQQDGDDANADKNSHEYRLKHDAEYRTEIIQLSLISKQVVGVSMQQQHGRIPSRQLVLGDVPNAPNDDNDSNFCENDRDIEAPANSDDVDTTTTANNNDNLYNEESCCPICLEAYQVGDVVSWSRFSDTATIRNSNDCCLHVFHKECIVAWFQHNINHNECPACRTILLRPTAATDTQDDDDNLIDMKKNDSSDDATLSTRVPSWTDDDDEMENDDVTNTSGKKRSVFVIVHGLISEAVQQYGRNLKRNDDITCTRTETHIIKSNNNTNNKDQYPDYESIFNLMEEGGSIVPALPSATAALSSWRRVLSFGRAQSRRQTQESIFTAAKKSPAGYEPILLTKSSSDGQQHEQQRQQCRDTTMMSVNGWLQHNSDLRRVVSAGPGTPESKCMSWKTDKEELMIRSLSSVTKDCSGSDGIVSTSKIAPTPMTFLLYTTSNRTDSRQSSSSNVVEDHRSLSNVATDDYDDEDEDTIITIRR